MHHNSLLFLMAVCLALWPAHAADVKFHWDHLRGKNKVYTYTDKTCDDRLTRADLAPSPRDLCIRKDTIQSLRFTNPQNNWCMVAHKPKVPGAGSAGDENGCTGCVIKVDRMRGMGLGCYPHKENARWDWSFVMVNEKGDCVSDNMCSQKDIDEAKI